MLATTDEHVESDLIEASVQYLANDEDLAVYIASVGGGEITPHDGNYVSQTVSIRNGRTRGGEPAP